MSPGVDAPKSPVAGVATSAKPPRVTGVIAAVAGAGFIGGWMMLDMSLEHPAALTASASAASRTARPADLSIHALTALKVIPSTP